MIEHNEEAPGSPYDWRGAYRARIRDNASRLRQERLAQDRSRYYIGTRCYVAKDLTDPQIDSLSRILAERDVEGAIRQRDENSKAERLRKGVAA